MIFYIFMNVLHFYKEKSFTILTWLIYRLQLSIWMSLEKWKSFFHSGHLSIFLCPFLSILQPEWVKKKCCVPALVFFSQFVSTNLRVWVWMWWTESVCSTAFWGNVERNGIHGLLRFSSLNGCSRCFTINSHWPRHTGDMHLTLPWHCWCLSDVCLFCW